jgi:DNA-binding HxlR family transcriptional regulator
VDLRTTQVLAVLDALAVEILLLLLDAPRSEKALLELLPDVKQSSLHKKLARMRQVGLIHRPGMTKVKGRGVEWQVASPETTAPAIAALLNLGETLDDRDREQRGEIRRRLGEKGAGFTLLPGGAQRDATG